MNAMMYADLVTAVSRNCPVRMAGQQCNNDLCPPCSLLKPESHNRLVFARMRRESMQDQEFRVAA